MKKREFKFRAWDKENGWMCGVVALDLWDLDCDLSTTQIYDLKTGVGHRRVLRDNIELMQYTGFKDKNGKDIYEGDIIKRSYGLYEVIFHKSWGAFAGKNLIPHQCVPFFNDSDKFEVIGNIFENPELTEVQL